MLVQAAEFEGADQYPGAVNGLGKGVGDAQTVEGPVAAHEAHLGAGHIWI